MTNLQHARQQEFARDYQDFETEGIVKLVSATGEWLERLLFDAGAVDTTMRALFHAVIGPEYAKEVQASTWRELWNGPLASHEFDVRSAQYFVELNRFAYYGLRPDAGFFGLGAECDHRSLEDDIETFVQVGRTLVNAAPRGWADTSELTQTVLAAEARLSIDLGRNVTIEQLSGLARVSSKSVRNMLTPKGGVPDLKLAADGGIAAEDATRWLQKRSDFLGSLWREEDGGADAGSAVVDDVIAEVVFIPVARDGSRFDAETCWRGQRGYTVGAKGAEEDIADYRVAIERLAHMAEPRWRRPNPQGHWGIVTGVSWLRRTAAELSMPSGEAA